MNINETSHNVHKLSKCFQASQSTHLGTLYSNPHWSSRACRSYLAYFSLIRKQYLRSIWREQQNKNNVFLSLISNKIRENWAICAQFIYKFSPNLEYITAWLKIEAMEHTKNWFYGAPLHKGLPGNDTQIYCRTAKSDTWEAQMTADLEWYHNQSEQQQLSMTCPKPKISRAITVFIELLLTWASLRSVLEGETAQRTILFL